MSQNLNLPACFVSLGKMPYREKEITKLYYTIGEVAEQFEVNTSLLRFWEKEFDILKPRKSSKGNRRYTIEDIENFRLIYHLVKERGYTLSGAKDKLKGGTQATSRNLELIQSLNKIKLFLIELKKGIKEEPAP